MPASMITACVALSPNVTGKRMLMPESGPMPGSIPTSVPTRQPRKAYLRLANSSATENPSSSDWKVLSTALETKRAGWHRRFEQRVEHEEGDANDNSAVEARAQDIAALDDHDERDHHQHHRDDEAEPRVERDRCCGHRNHRARMLEVAPVDVGERRALAATQKQHQSEEDQQPGHEIRHESRAGHGQSPERKLAGEREHDAAEYNERGAGDVVGS